MKYQETYITADNNADFDRIVNRMQEVGENFYRVFRAGPSEILTFTKDHAPFRAGQKAIYIKGDRYLQAQASRLIRYMLDEDHDLLSLGGIKKFFDEAMEFYEYNMQVVSAELVDPVGIWPDHGNITDVVHEPWEWEVSA